MANLKFYVEGMKPIMIGTGRQCVEGGDSVYYAVHFLSFGGKS